MTQTRFSGSLTLIVVICAYSQNLRADCYNNVQDVVPDSLDDKAHTRFMNMSAQNRLDFIDVFNREYMDYKLWPGIDHPEQSATFWAKWANSAWMANFGIDSTNMPTGGCVPGFCVNFNDRPWHGRKDYRRLAKSCHTYAHDEYDSINYSPFDPDHPNRDSEFITYSDLINTNEEVILFCPTFDPTQYPNKAEPIYRAGVTIHEGQHAWQFRWLGHQWHDGSCNGHTCDNYNYHRRYDIADGDLVHWTHEPYQVQREFFCDIAEHYNNSIPLDFVFDADFWARYSDEFILNGPPPVCGSPLPIGVNRVNPSMACPWTGCNSVADCPFYGLYTAPVCTSGCCQESFLPPPIT